MSLVSRTEDVKRPYESPLRARQAATTRTAIVRAATDLFSERGYAATSMDAIADRAGVGRATLFTALGSKKALLKSAYDVALVGDNEPISLPDRPGSIDLKAEPDPARFLTRYAGLCVEFGGRVATIYEVVRSAADADADVREVWEKIGQERRVGAGNVVALVEAKGTLRPGLDYAMAGDIVWTLNDPGLYHLLVNRRGWVPDAFGEWLAFTLASQLLPQP